MPTSDDRSLSRRWQETIEAERREGQRIESSRRADLDRQRAGTVRDGLDRRFSAAHAAAKNDSNEKDDGGTEEGRGRRWLPELDTRLPSPLPNAALPTPPQSAVTIELPTHSPVSSRGIQQSQGYNSHYMSPVTRPRNNLQRSPTDDSATSELETQIQRQKAYIEQVEKGLEEKDSQIRNLLLEKEETEEAHLRAVLNDQQADITRLERMRDILVRDLRSARADASRLSEEMEEARARERVLKQQVSETEQQMHSNERQWRVRMENATPRQLHADADLEAGRLSSTRVAETLSQSPQLSQSHRRSSNASHAASSTRSRRSELCFDVPRGNRNAPIKAALFRHVRG